MKQFPCSFIVNTRALLPRAWLCRILGGNHKSMSKWPKRSLKMSNERALPWTWHPCYVLWQKAYGDGVRNLVLALQIMVLPTQCFERHCKLSVQAPNSHKNEGGNNRWTQSSKFGTGGVGIPTVTQMGACHSLEVSALWKVAELWHKGLCLWPFGDNFMAQQLGKSRSSRISPGLSNLQACAGCLYTEGIWWFITEAKGPVTWEPLGLLLWQYLLPAATLKCHPTTGKLQKETYLGTGVWLSPITVCFVCSAVS